MISAPVRLKRFAGGFALCLPGLLSAAPGLRGVAQTLEGPGFRAEGIELIARLLGDDRRITGSAQRLRLDGLGIELTELVLDCMAEVRGELLRCTGRGGWRWQGVRVEGAIELARAANSVSLRWRDGSAEVRIEGDLEGGSFRSELAGVPLTPFAAWASSLWPELLLQSGRVSGRLDLHLAEGDRRLQAAFRVAALGFDTRDGSAGAVNAGIEANLALRLGAEHHGRIEATLTGGEWLFGPLYLELEQERIVVAADWVLPTHGGLRLDRVAVAEPGVFSLEGGMHWRAEAGATAAEIMLQVDDASRFLARRAASLTALAGFAGLAGEGRALLRARLQEGRLTEFGLIARSLSLRDPQGRLEFEDVSGSFDFAPVPRHRRSELRGRSAALYGLRIGPWEAQLQSGSSSLALAAPLSLALLGGSVVLDEAEVRRSEDGESEVTLAIRVENLSLGELAGHLGWPRFPGTISGRLPRAQYRAGQLHTEGALEIEVFDGRIVARGLALERPFGILPTLSADLRIERLDLARITGVFDFGLIEGRLSGQVDGLRLIDWKPVAFSARLAAERSGTRRISQRAVENLAALGGGGAAAAIQRGIVGAFSSFSYEELGLSCVLTRHVCIMGGVGSAGAGYFILRGRGIPRVDVIGHQREVDWPVLLARLKSAIASGGPVVE